MAEEETHQYEKSAKRKLLLEPSSAPAEQGVKLMASAFRAAVPVAEIPEETAEESSVAGLSHQAGLRSMGPALMGEASYHPADDEGRSDSEAGDAESAPVASPVTQMPVESQAGGEVEKVAESQSPSALMMHETAIPSPTTGLLARLTPAGSSRESSEQVSYGTSIDEVWGDHPVPSPGKASAYIPASPHRSPAKAASPSPVAVDLPSEPIVTEQETATVAPPATSAPLVISLRPIQELGALETAPAEAFKTLPSSPSALEVMVPSASSSSAYTAVTPVVVTTTGTSSSSPLSPVIIPNLLGTLLGQLEVIMRMARDAVEAGQGSIEFFKPLLLNNLNSIATLGNAELTKCCSECIAHLEEDLKALQELNGTDLDARIESTLTEARVQAMRRLALIQKDLDEKESRAISLKTQRDLRAAELSSMASAAQVTRASIAELRAELARQEEKLSQEEAAVEGLTREGAKLDQDYCEMTQAVSVAQEELAAATPNEEALRREATAAVQGAHEKEVAEVKARLASIVLPRPAA